MTRDEAYAAFEAALESLGLPPKEHGLVRHAAVEYAHAAAMETIESVMQTLRKEGKLSS